MHYGIPRDCNIQNATGDRESNRWPIALISPFFLLLLLLPFSFPSELVPAIIIILLIGKWFPLKYIYKMLRYHTGYKN